MQCGCWVAALACMFFTSPTSFGSLLGACFCVSLHFTSNVSSSRDCLLTVCLPAPLLLHSSVHLCLCCRVRCWVWPARNSNFVPTVPSWPVPARLPRQ
jgi:hypothetical protein